MIYEAGAEALEIEEGYAEYEGFRNVGDPEVGSFYQRNWPGGVRNITNGIQRGLRRGAYVLGASYLGSKMVKMEDGYGTVPTAQYMQERTVYRRSRAPKRLRRRAKKSWSRFMKNQIRLQAPNIMDLQDVGLEGPTLANGQKWAFIPLLYTVGGSSGFADLFSLYNGKFNKTTTVDLSSTGTGIVSAASDPGPRFGPKTIFSNGVLDVIVSNPESFSIYVDVYEIQARSTNGARDLGKPDLTFSPAYLSQIGSVIDKENLFVTAFDSPDFTARWKINKLTKMYVGPGTSFSLQLKDTRNHFVNPPAVFGDSGNCVWDGITKGFMLCFRGDLNSADGTTRACSLRWLCNRNYRFKIVNDKIGTASIQ